MSMIAQPVVKMGEQAAKLLLKRIDKDFSGFPEIHRLKTELIIRETTRSI